MNEHIDIILTASKLATGNHPAAHLTAQALSMGYNASMLWYYNYQLGMAQAMGPGYLPVEQIQTYRRERVKHTILLGLECVVLIAAGIGALCETQRR